MKKLSSILLSLLFVIGLAGCGDSGSPNTADTSSTADASSNAVDEFVTVTHELGETEIQVNPEKVIVLDFGVLDILDKMNIEIGGLPQSNLPGYLSKYESDDYVNTGNLKELDFEAVNEYGPDLIILSGRLSDSYDECSEIAPTIYIETPGATYLESMQKNVDILRQIFPDKADDMKAEMDAILANAEDLKADGEASGFNALVLMANDGSLSVFGSGSRYGIIHDDFGFAAADTDIDASTHGMEASFEYISEINPDVIFVIDRSAAIGGGGGNGGGRGGNSDSDNNNDGDSDDNSNDSGAASLLDNDLVNGTTAAKEGRIVYLSSDIWYLANGGFTGTAEMIVEVQGALK